jgi:ketosteroid isomerase-like protein
VAALALLVALGCARGAPVAANAPLRAADETAIRGTLDGMARAWNAADLPAHVAPYLDSAAFMTGAGPIRGRERTEASLRRSFWRDGRPTQALRFERVEARPLGADHALVTGRFVLAGGDVAERSGWFTLVWVRTTDGWRILHDHSG